MRAPKYLSIPTYIGSLDLYRSREYPHTYFVSGFVELSGSFFALYAPNLDFRPISATSVVT